MINSLIIAFSMYSRIPMPRVEWREESMKYVMCFFPLIGVIIGAVVYIAGRLML
ncbi:MAG: adenosylcobinamide-GDP ribazoletransferase, partial [Candidatus Ornithomonoglobus sp.]